jgi:hypothetical protein
MILVVLIALFVGEVALLRYMGVRAMRPSGIQVQALTLDEIVAVGTKVSNSRMKRIFTKPKPQHLPDGSVAWPIRSKAGEMVVVVGPASGGGYEVLAAATTVMAARLPGYADPDTDWGRSKIIATWFCARLGIPQNARKLLWQRRRVMKAISRAELRAVARSAASSGPAVSPGPAAPSGPAAPGPAPQQ